MKSRTLPLLAAVLAAALLGACERQEPRTIVHSPGPSLPDDTVLRAPDQPLPEQGARPGGETSSSVTPPVAPATEAMGAAPAAPAPGGEAPQPAPQAAAPLPPYEPLQEPPAGASEPSAAAAQPSAAAGTAAPTEMSRALPPAGGASAPAKVSAAGPATRVPGDVEGARLLAQRSLLVPVAGVQPASLSDQYELGRGDRKHEAIDLMAPAGTPVVAVDDGRIAKLFTSKPGGLTVYQFDPAQRLSYYYAHLQGYAPGLREGMEVRRGDLIGYVGSTGNANPRAPHLHFAVFRLGTPPKWWEGEAVNPYPALRGARASEAVAAR